MSGGHFGGDVYALTAHDDGGGPALYAGGLFTTAGGAAANRIAKWNGTNWMALGSGVSFGYFPKVNCLLAYDDGGGPALYAGGDFASAPDSGDSYLAKWGCPPDTTPPVLSCPASVTVLDRSFDRQEVVSFTVTATDALDPAPIVVCVPPSGSLFPLGTTLVDCTATDASGNSSTCQFPVTVQRKSRPR